MKNRDSLARKSHFNGLCGGYQAKICGGHDSSALAQVTMSNIAVRYHLFRDVHVCVCGGGGA